MTFIVMEKSFQKYKPRMIKFRDYRHFQKNTFREGWLSELLNFTIEISDKGFTELFETCNKHLNYYAPCKQKYNSAVFPKYPSCFEYFVFQYSK